MAAKLWRRVPPLRFVNVQGRQEVLYATNHFNNYRWMDVFQRCHDAAGECKRDEAPHHFGREWFTRYRVHGESFLPRHYECQPCHIKAFQKIGNIARADPRIRWHDEHGVVIDPDADAGVERMETGTRLFSVPRKAVEYDALEWRISPDTYCEYPTMEPPMRIVPSKFLDAACQRGLSRAEAASELCEVLLQEVRLCLTVDRLDFGCETLAMFLPADKLAYPRLGGLEELLAYADLSMQDVAPAGMCDDDYGVLDEEINPMGGPFVNIRITSKEKARLQTPPPCPSFDMCRMKDVASAVNDLKAMLSHKASHKVSPQDVATA